jgi:PhnB protein
MSTNQNDAVVQPYLFFEGRCEEALEFYGRALGAEVLMMMRYKDSPEPPMPGSVAPGSDNKIMHATLRIGQTTLMASDGCCFEKPYFKGFALSLTPSTEAAAERQFSALSDGGHLLMPLTKTFFSPCFGMVTDRFGVLWMVIVRSQAA